MAKTRPRPKRIENPQSITNVSTTETTDHVDQSGYRSARPARAGRRTSWGVLTMTTRTTRTIRALTAAITAAMLADVLHRASHAPWQCDETCPRPWGRGAELCGATDGLGLHPDSPDPFGRCTLGAGHQTGGWHQEWRGAQLWAEWRGPAPGERCGICGKDGAEH